MGETGNTQAMPPEASQDGGLSFAGIFKVFYEPTAFFTKLKNNPKVLVPYLALAVLLIIFFVMTGDLLVNFSMKAMQERAASGTPMPSRGMMWGSTVIGGTIAMLIAPLLIALLAMLFGNFIMGGAARFKQLLSFVLYGEIIYGLGMVVNGILMVLKNSMFVSLSAGVLMSNPNPQSWVYALLTKISIFYIWELIALGIGLSVLYGFSRNKGFVLSVLSVGLLSLIQIAWTAIMA